LEVLATRGHRLALLHQRFELADGDVGPSETESVNVAESDEHGRFATLVTFDADQLDAAYAELDRRYADEAAHGQVALWMGAAFRPLGWETRDAALARGVDLRPDPLRIPPNAATRASERQRKGLELTVLATAGDRLALERVRCSHANDGTPVSQTETLSLTEIDADGRIVAVLDFDADDRRAASAELRDRYARSDAASAPAAMFEAFRAFNDHDLDRFRATLHNDFVFHDHRRTGVGTLARADYLASIPPLFEAAPDICSDTLYYIATEKNGSLAIGRDFGTLRDGGEFESVYVRIELYRDDRIVALEEFEPEHLDRARARFEELSRGA
jgi:ketosteroid isomerase-like protein